MCWWLQQAQLNHYQLLCLWKKVPENPSVRREDGHGECSVSLAAVLLAITNMARCRRLRVVTVIDIICHCCCCFFVVFLRLRNSVRTSSWINKLWLYSVPCHIFDMTLTTLSVWLVPYSSEPTINYPMWSVPPAAIAGIPTFVGSRHDDSFADRAPVYFTCGCPALKWVWESRL